MMYASINNNANVREGAKKKKGNENITCHPGKVIMWKVVESSGVFVIFFVVCRGGGGVEEELA
jgi:hypothetical protein